MTKRKPKKAAPPEPCTALAVIPVIVEDYVEPPPIEAKEDPQGRLDSDHCDEAEAAPLRGSPDAVDLKTIDADWVLRRLVKEATDFGARTRQTSRVKALEMIGTTLGMWDEGKPPDDPAERALRLDPIERRQRILALANQLSGKPGFDKAKH